MGREVQPDEDSTISDDEKQKAKIGVAYAMYKIQNKAKREEDEKDDLHYLKKLNARETLEFQPVKPAPSKQVK